MTQQETKDKEFREAFEALLEWAMEANSRMPYEVHKATEDGRTFVFGSNPYLNPHLKNAADALGYNDTFPFNKKK